MQNFVDLEKFSEQQKKQLSVYLQNRLRCNRERARQVCCTIRVRQPWFGIVSVPDPENNPERMQTFNRLLKLSATQNCYVDHLSTCLRLSSLNLLFQRSFAQSRAEKEQYHGKQMQGRKLAVNLKTHNQNAPKGVADWKWKKRARFFPACAPIMLGGWGRLRSPRRT